MPIYLNISCTPLQISLPPCSLSLYCARVRQRDGGANRKFVTYYSTHNITILKNDKGRNKNLTDL